VKRGGTTSPTIALSGTNSNLAEFAEMMKTALFIEFIKGCLKFDNAHKRSLGTHFRGIADLLEAVKDELDNGLVPRESSHQLATLINFTNETLHGVFRIPNDEEIDDIFTKQLPRIGYLLRSADVFIDGQPRDGVHKYMRVLNARNDDYKVSPQSASLAIEEIERAVGRLRSAANFLDPNGKVAASESKKKSIKKSGGSKISSKKTEGKKTLAKKATKARGAERQTRKRDGR
jgi:hypothetical protein